MARPNIQRNSHDKLAKHHQPDENALICAVLPCSKKLLCDGLETRSPDRAVDSSPFQRRVYRTAFSQSESSSDVNDDDQAGTRRESLSSREKWQVTGP